jgi:hypothetical protein
MLAMLTSSSAFFGAAWYDVPVEPRGQVAKAMGLQEVVFVFTAAFADEAAYEIGEQAIVDTPDRTRFDLAAARGLQPAPVSGRGG